MTFRFFSEVAVALTMILTLARAQAPVPDMSGEYRWGTLRQRGKSFTITGHGFWRCIGGNVRADGQVEMFWEEIETGRHAFGLYRYDRGSFRGFIGWADRVEVRDGRLVQTHPSHNDHDDHPEIIADSFAKTE